MIHEYIKSSFEYIQNKLSVYKCRQKKTFTYSKIVPKREFWGGGS